MTTSTTRRSNAAQQLFAFATNVLGNRCTPVLVAVLAVVFTPPSLRAGLLVDDYHHELLMSGSDSVVRLLESPLDMLQFFDGDPNRLTEIVDYGFLPWWT